MYVVYGKRKTEKRFKPFNMSLNSFVINRIHMTVYQQSQYEELKKEVNYMNEHNKDYIFEIRKV